MVLRVKTLLVLSLLVGCGSSEAPSFGCILGQESQLIETIIIKASDGDIPKIEETLRNISVERQMMFGSAPSALFSSGRQRVSFHLCGEHSYVFAARVEDQDELSIFVSHILEGNRAEADALVKQIRGAFRDQENSK